MHLTCTSLGQFFGTSVASTTLSFSPYCYLHLNEGCGCASEYQSRRGCSISKIVSQAILFLIHEASFILLHVSYSVQHCLVIKHPNVPDRRGCLKIKDF
jgi:hypothetical protein